MPTVLTTGRGYIDPDQVVTNGVLCVWVLLPKTVSDFGLVNFDLLRPLIIVGWHDAPCP